MGPQSVRNQGGFRRGETQRRLLCLRDYGIVYTTRTATFSPQFAAVYLLSEESQKWGHSFFATSSRVSGQKSLIPTRAPHYQH